jgi:hypothetical protein
MSTRISSLLPVLLIAGCGESAPSNGPAPPPPTVAAKGEVVAAPPPKTLCAVGGVADFERLCDRDIVDGLLTIRHPDGGFRRFEIVTDGRGLIAADGAEPATVATVGNDMIEVSIAGDRYRLPATVER